MISAIQKEFQLHYGTDPAYVDFQPSSQHIISVLDEAEILQGPEHVQRRLARLYKLAHETGSVGRLPAVIYLMTDLTRPQFSNIQSLCVLDFSIPIIPVDTLDQVPQLLERFKVTTRIKKNPFKTDKNLELKTDNEMVLTLLRIPGISEKQARNLLVRFGDVRSVFAASEAELATVLGPRAARGFYASINRQNKV